jgi:fucokinase
MHGTFAPWDYLIVTAANDTQAKAYESQLALRRTAGELSGVRTVLVVGDPDGRRVGSGGSTLCCLLEVVNRELAAAPQEPLSEPRIAALLARLRILIIHAGGDSRRLPAYGPCGKVFIPLPEERGSGAATTLFDRLAPAFLALPAGRPDGGQVVITAGDVLTRFDPSLVDLAKPGLTALACPAPPEHASRHGAFCPGAAGRARLYLQKPSVAEQARLGAIDGSGRALLDIGVMSFDARVALALFRAFDVSPGPAGALVWREPARAEVLAQGLDFYREICCAWGAEATAAHHAEQARRSGSPWSERRLAELFRALAGIPLHLQVVPCARFLHFGTTRQLLRSSLDLLKQDGSPLAPATGLLLNSERLAGGEIHGGPAWIEGCRLHSSLSLGGNNVVLGLDVEKPLSLPAQACLDLLPGAARSGGAVHFVRCYGVDDDFKAAADSGGTFCGRPTLDWLAVAQTPLASVWEPGLSAEERTLWNARLFPAESEPQGYRRWLWMFNPSQATPEQRRSYRAADRHSAAEIAVLADQEAFFARRRRLRAGAPSGGGRPIG